MTNVFFFSKCEHKQRKVYKYTRKFCRPISRRFLQVFLSESAAEYAQYRSPQVIWKRLRQFKAIVMFFFFFEEQQISVFHLIQKNSRRNSKHPRPDLGLKQSVNDFKKGKSQQNLRRTKLCLSQTAC